MSVGRHRFEPYAAALDFDPNVGPWFRACDVVTELEEHHREVHLPEPRVELAADLDQEVRVSIGLIDVFISPPSLTRVTLLADLSHVQPAELSLLL